MFDIIFFFFFLAAFCQMNETLRHAASRAGIFIGSCGNAGHLSNDKEYRIILAQQYDLITAENACKWAATEPKQGFFNFDGCDAVCEFSSQSNAKFRGHNLCWGAYNPKWLLDGKFSPEQKEGILVDHIKTVVGRYKGKAYAWDVVNEAVDDDGKGLKKNVWYPDIPNYIDLAFNASRKFDPDVKLFYNDYSAESMNRKSDYIYNMVEGMVKRGIPIDGVGFQMHISLSYYPSSSSFEQNLKRFTDLGLEVQVTEMDIQTPDFCDRKCLEKQAEIYAMLLKICMENEKCTNFETWGFTDKYSWFGVKKHPLPFDQNYKPKPAAISLLRLLQEAQRETNLRSL